jgi:hypothetical protein
MRRSLLIIAVVVGAITAGHAATQTAANCTQAAVQTAFNAASDGDTVAIPACSLTTWVGIGVPPSGIDFCKSVTIQGAGVGQTIIGSNFNGDLFSISSPCATKTVRLTGIDFRNTSTASEGILQFKCTDCNIRIDHNNFQSPTQARAGWMKRIPGAGAAVVDHNTFDNMGMMFSAGEDGGPEANTSWQGNPSFGTANAWYIEDNTVTHTSADAQWDCEVGGRVVYRHNTFNSNGQRGEVTGPFDHGYDSVSRSCFELDVYDNTIIRTTAGYAGIQFRGGSGLVYNNLISPSGWDGGAFIITNYRSASGSIGQNGNNKGNYCDGTINVDGNVSPGTTYGWPCRDQIGRGKDSGIPGAQGAYPLYAWNNCAYGGSLGCTPTGGSAVPATAYQAYGGTDRTAQELVVNRDWYDFSTLGTLVGNGTAGVGQGTLASRPGTCSVNASTGKGPAYWATDQNTLYQCSATNTWSSYYTPYTYPHPLAGGGTPVVSISPSSLTFAPQIFGTTSASQPFTLSNVGTGTLTISSISVSGDFAQTNTCGATLAASASCTINVTFTPTAAGTRNGVLAVVDNQTNSYGASVSGTGVSPVALSPSALTFGSQLIGTTSAIQTITVTNNGASPFSFGSYSLTGTFTSYFPTQSPPWDCGTQINAGANCHIFIAFAPTDLGNPTVQLQVNGDPDNNNFVLITGVAIPRLPNAVLSATALDFGAQGVGTTSASQDVTLSNTGTAVLNIASIAITGDFAQTNTCAATVAVGASCTIHITFSPLSLNVRSGLLTVTDDSGGVAGSTQTATLTGLGISALVKSTWGKATPGASFTMTKVYLTGGGGPLTYAARTDNCVTGGESGCVGGRTTGQAGSALTFRNRDADLSDSSKFPFTEFAPANTAVTDPDFGAFMVLATDISTANQTTTFTMGAQGNYDAWSKDDSLFLAGTGGGAAYVLAVDIAKLLAHTCVPVTSPCFTYTGIHTGTKDATHLATGGDFVWSSKTGEGNVMFEMDPTGTAVNKLVIAPTGTCGQTWCVTRTLYVDFKSDTPVPCSVIPSTYSAGWTGIFAAGSDDSVGYALGGGPSWQPATTYTTDSFIYPLPSSCGTAGHCDGYQATTPGTSGSAPGPDFATNCPNDNDTCSDNGIVWKNIGHLASQGKGFDILSYKVGQGCSRLNTRIGKVYRGTGNVAPAGTWQADNADVCTRFNGGVNPCPLPDLLTIHDANQYRDSNIISIGPTGGETALCLVSGQCSCLATPGNSGSTHELCDVYYWQVDSLRVRPCLDGACNGHSAKGYIGDYRGKLYTQHNPYNPTNSTGVTALPGKKMIADQSVFSTDQHGTYQNSGSLDLSPVFLAPGDVPSTGRTGSGYTATYYNEVVSGSITTNGDGPIYRFAHNYNTGSNANFGVQNNISVVSQTGRFMAVTTDVMGTRGSTTTGGATCNKLRADIAPVANQAVTTGQRAYPVTQNANNSIFEAQGNGNQGATLPNWGAAVLSGGCPNVNDICTESTGLQWKNLGINDCRGDILVIDLLSARPKP